MRVLAMAMAWTGLAAADDWPNWLGPTRDNRWHEPGILKQLPAGGLKTAWRAPVFGGYSGPAVAGGKVYVHDFDSKGTSFTNSKRLV